MVQHGKEALTMDFLLNDSDRVYRSIDCIVNEEKLGEITWKEADGVMHVNHTYVSDHLRGQGVAKQLLDKAAHYAREHELKINAICSYVESAFQKYDEYKDVKL